MGTLPKHELIYQVISRDLKHTISEGYINNYREKDRYAKRHGQKERKAEDRKTEKELELETETDKMRERERRKRN